MNTKSIVKILLLPSALLLQAGCSYYEPYEVPEPGVPQGPGLLSGETGKYEIEFDR